MALAINNLQRLIYYQTKKPNQKSNQTAQPTNQIDTETLKNIHES